jgi:hypothetical protein
MKKVTMALIFTVSLLFATAPSFANAATTSSAAVTQTGTVKSINSTASVQSAIARVLMWTNGSTSHYATIHYSSWLKRTGTIHGGTNTTYYVYTDANGTVFNGMEY